MLVCERCVLNPSTGVRALVERWAGVDNLGVMVIGKDGIVYGTLPAEVEIDEAVKEGGDIVDGVVEGKRKVEEVEENVESSSDSKRVKIDIEDSTSLLISQSASSSQASTSRSIIESITSTSSLLPSPLITSTNSEICSAPLLPSTENPSILTKIQQEGGKLNIYFAEDWRERWCRCSEVSLRSSNTQHYLH